MIFTNSYLNGLFWLIYSIAIVIGIEVFAYLWHRYGAHNNYIPGIQETHKIHHTMNLSHEADEDFIWILLIVIFLEVIVGITIMIGLMPGVPALIAIVISIIIFSWNWWIHGAYHQTDHWLNSYQWFQLEKQRHYVHHYQPDRNFGIASHFSDKIMGTWHEPTLE